MKEELRGVRVEKGACRLCREFLFQAGSSGAPFPGSSHILEELLPRGAVWAEWAGCKQGGPRAGGDHAGPRGWPSAQPWSWRGFGTSKAWVPARLRVSHPPLFPPCPCSQGPCSAAPPQGTPLPRPGVAWGPLEKSLGVRSEFLACLCGGHVLPLPLRKRGARALLMWPLGPAPPVQTGPAL